MPEEKEGPKKPATSAELKEEEKQKLVRMSEISLSLDSYDDIFSDFDPRPYSQRALSDDFLNEARRASRDKVSGTIEVIFMIPAGKRDIHQENLIKRRMREHFKKHYPLLKEEKRDVTKRGLYFALSGIALMLIATFILFRYRQSSFLTSFIVVLLEPAGWFLFWEGLNQTIFESGKKAPDLEFYKKMSKCEISFLAY